jgi:hypothetical protein
MAEQAPASAAIRAHARCSCTSRTVRSRTFREYRVRLYTTPTSQTLEPQAIPGRSTHQTAEQS